MNENSQKDLCIDPLFVGLTRPATIWGIPYTAFVIEFMSTTLIFLAVGNPLYLGIAIPIHGILYLICASDIGVFGSIVVWMQTIGRCRNIRYWGAASFSPLPKWKN
jgi:type IV secretion system protein VirB3